MTTDNVSWRHGTNTIGFPYRAPRTIRSLADGSAGNAGIYETSVPAAPRRPSLFARFCEALHRSRTAEAKRLIGYYRRLTRDVGGRDPTEAD